VVVLVVLLDVGVLVERSVASTLEAV